MKPSKYVFNIAISLGFPSPRCFVGKILHLNTFCLDADILEQFGLCRQFEGLSRVFLNDDRCGVGLAGREIAEAEGQGRDYR